MTDIRAGDTFRFRGLRDHHGQYARGATGDRTITILSISVSGDVCYRLDIDDDPDDARLFNIQLERIELMISTGAWLRRREGVTVVRAQPAAEPDIAPLAEALAFADENEGRPGSLVPVLTAARALVDGNQPPTAELDATGLLKAVAHELGQYVGQPGGFVGVTTLGPEDEWHAEASIHLCEFTARPDVAARFAAAILGERKNHQGGRYEVCIWAPYIDGWYTHMRVALHDGTTRRRAETSQA